MHEVIAIDGPAASGKSTVSKSVAKRFGILYVNSGAMYRAVTWSVLRAGVDPAEEGEVTRHLHAISIETGINDGRATISINGVDPGIDLVSEEVNSSVSAVSKHASVRERLVAEQRKFADLGSLVMEGRDIGTAVFPGTPHKFFLDASTEVREARRRAQGIEDDLAARDKQDSGRKIAPLKVAEDAQIVDTSELSIDGVVDAICRALVEAGWVESERSSVY
ncbi:MAG: (d)CMP kinase [Verrucomicrobiota bacterium]